MSSSYRPALHASLVFLTDTAATAIYTLSLHDALPIYRERRADVKGLLEFPETAWPDQIPLLYYSYHVMVGQAQFSSRRSEEHTSELQSLRHLVCRLLLEKKNQNAAADRLEDALTHSDH